MFSLFSGWKQIQQQQQNAGPGCLQQVDPCLALEDAGAPAVGHSASVPVVRALW